MMPRVTLFACLLLFLLRFLLRFDESWRRFQLFQFLSAGLGYSHLLAGFIELL